MKGKISRPAMRFLGTHWKKLCVALLFAGSFAAVVVLVEPREDVAGEQEQAGSSLENRRLIEELRKELKDLPKLEFQLHKVAVHTDGVVMVATIANKSNEPMRLSLVRLPLLIRHQTRFKDAANDDWKLTGLKSRYQFDDTDSETTCVIDALGRADLFIVHDLEAPTLNRVKEKTKVGVEARPESLRYSIEVLPTIAHEDTRKPRLVVRLVGEGTTALEWSNKGLPEGSKTRVTDTPHSTRPPDR